MIYLHFLSSFVQFLCDEKVKAFPVTDDLAVNNITNTPQHHIWHGAAVFCPQEPIHNLQNQLYELLGTPVWLQPPTGLLHPRVREVYRQSASAARGRELQLGGEQRVEPGERQWVQTLHRCSLISQMCTVMVLIRYRRSYIVVTDSVNVSNNWSVI